nr:biotin-dependent carboxyltransferase family protein [Gordonia araii]
MTVLDTGPLATIQDLGREGFANLGVPRSGAADRGALRLANRLVGNPEDSAAIEITHGGLAVRVIGDAGVAVTGAAVSLAVDERPTGRNATVLLHDGQTLRVGAPRHGCRAYLSVRGGIVAEPVLGSLSTDTLSGLGPPPIARGDLLDVGTSSAPWPATQSAPAKEDTESTVVLAASPGPRADRLVDPDALFVGLWTVNPASNRVGVRLDRISGPPVEHRPGSAELASEGIAHGSIQVPPSGQPVLFGPDHPVTGGYPVVAVLTESAADRAGQLTPGTTVRLRRVD